MNNQERPVDTVTGLREIRCRGNHPLKSSVRRWHSGGKGRWSWVCQDCDRERWGSKRPPLTGEALEARRAYQKEHYRTRGTGLARLSGSAPSWKPGLGHCELTENHPRRKHLAYAMTVKPSVSRPFGEVDTEYALAQCNGVGAAPACPVREQCLKWAQAQPMFVGIAGGMMFGKTDKEESAA